VLAIFWLDEKAGTVTVRYPAAAGPGRVRERLADLHGHWPASAGCGCRGCHATSSRLDDFSPWAGGSRIGTSKGSCTAGFAIHQINSPDNQQLLTAGHCTKLLEQIVNGGEVIGRVTAIERSEGGLDVAHISGQQYAPFIYMGGPDSTDGRNIVGTQPIVNGMGACTSGKATGRFSGDGAIVLGMMIALSEDGRVVYFHPVDAVVQEGWAVSTE
jgi:hypothetical protein